MILPIFCETNQRRAHRLRCSAWGAAEDAKMATRMGALSSVPLEVFPLPALDISAMEASSGSDNSAAAESAEDTQAPSEVMAADVAADVPTSADRRVAMYEAPPIDAPVLWTTSTEPAEQSAMQAMAGKTPTDSSEDLIISLSQAGTMSHAEAGSASAATEEPGVSSGAVMDPIASPEFAWSGLDSWAAAAASLGGVPFAAPDQPSLWGILGVQQQSTAAPSESTVAAAAEASADSSRSSGGVEVGATPEDAGAGVSTDSSQFSNSAELQNTAENSSANAMAAADLSADSSRLSRNNELQSSTDDGEADALAAADRTSNGNLPNSSGTESNTADSAQPNAAAAAAAQLDSSWRRSNGEQRRRTDASGNGARSNSSRWSTADGMKEPVDRRENFSSRLSQTLRPSTTYLSLASCCRILGCAGDVQHW